MKSERNEEKTEKVLELLTDPLTRKILVTLMGLDPNIIAETKVSEKS
ncbi:MAG: hypothetical protein BAJATHORv1_10634 [Candidatus Thorarchaeota archaeon]|nr:MAG: hypothetical protein BAJATHORv1_10634 [Candidatus Thorarchaeota archaeon]